MSPSRRSRRAPARSSRTPSPRAKAWCSTWDAGSRWWRDVPCDADSATNALSAKAYRTPRSRIVHNPFALLQGRGRQCPRRRWRARVVRGPDTRSGERLLTGSSAVGRARTKGTPPGVGAAVGEACSARQRARTRRTIAVRASGASNARAMWRGRKARPGDLPAVGDHLIDLQSVEGDLGALSPGGQLVLEVYDRVELRDRVDRSIRRDDEQVRRLA